LAHPAIHSPLKRMPVVCIVPPMPSPDKSPPAATTPVRGDDVRPSWPPPVSAVWGVGEERARLLARREIRTVEDLLLHKPRRYEDRRKFGLIRDLKLKEP